MFGWIEAISCLRLRRGFSIIQNWLFVRYLDLINLENKLILSDEHRFLNLTPGLQECQFFYEGQPYVVCIIPLEWNMVH